MRVSEEESDEYFSCRPTGSKVGQTLGAYDQTGLAAGPALDRVKSRFYFTTCVADRHEAKNVWVRTLE